jgi:carbonic anhydrase/acetyltransferase-like protein (isoleucine patch superfamily)
MPIIPFKTDSPQIDPTAFIAPDAWIIGKTRIGARSSVFFNVVVRGDVQPITIGAETNLQEHVLVHSSRGMSPVIIGDRVTVGHRAIIHGCRIGDERHRYSPSQLSTRQPRKGRKNPPTAGARRASDLSQALR